jgi:hypothetical protein
MTALRQRMTEDMQVRNLALKTQTSSLQWVSLLARHFHKSPEELGHKQIRDCQFYDTNEKRLARWPDSHCRAYALSLQNFAQMGMAFR